MNRVRRIFNVIDEDLPVLGGLFHKNLKESISIFQTKFPFVTTGYLDNFSLLLDTVKAVMPDVSIRLDKKVLTQNIHQAKKLAADELSNLSLYARLAYPGDPGKQKLFARSNWPTATGNASTLITALGLAHELATQAAYATDLQDKGYTPENAAQLLLLAEALNTAVLTRDAFQSNRPVATDARVHIYNVLWSAMREVATMSQVVYRNDPAARKQFRLYGGAKRSKKKVEPQQPDAGGE